MHVKVSRLWGLVAVAALLMLLVGCGSSDDSASPAARGGGDSSGYLARARADLERLYHGTDEQAPASGPKAQGGKTVWLISCAEAAEGCAVFSQEAKKAAAELGWRMTVFDGNFNANNAYAIGVRQAVAARADGIILSGVDCDQVKQPLKEAKAAGVATVEANGASDCSDSQLASATVIPTSEQRTPHDWYVAWGQHKATWTIAQLEGRGKVLNFALSGVAHTVPVDAGFRQGMDACTECKVETIDVTLTDLSSNGFVQKVSDALVRNPDARVIVVPYDNLVTGGIAPALKHAGNPDVDVLGGEGLESNIQLIRSGSGQTADIAYDTGWTAWGAADALNRVFAGERQVPQGFGFTAMDAKHNLPAGRGAFVSKVDFRAGYRKVWAGS
jgi:ribose transport system substrate-binding protein